MPHQRPFHPIQPHPPWHHIVDIIGPANSVFLHSLPDPPFTASQQKRLLMIYRLLYSSGRLGHTNAMALAERIAALLHPEE